LYGIKIWTDFSSVLSQYMRVTDGQTDGWTEFSSIYQVCITCSKVKTVKELYQNNSIILKITCTSVEI